MKKKIIWILIAALIVTIGFLASLSDPPEDESIRFVDINSYISKEDMFIDIDGSMDIPVILTPVLAILTPLKVSVFQRTGYI